MLTSEFSPKIIDFTTHIDPKNILDLHYLELSTHEIPQLTAWLEKNQQVIGIDLHLNELTNDKLLLSFLEKLPTFPQITYLNLAQNPCTLNSSILRILFKNPFLLEFNYEFSMLEEVEHDAKYWLAFQIHTWLTRNRILHRIIRQEHSQLDLANLPLVKEDIKLICNMLVENTVTHLTHIDFSFCNLIIDKKLAKKIGILIEMNPLLKNINLIHNNIRVGGKKQFHKILRKAGHISAQLKLDKDMYNFRVHVNDRLQAMDSPSVSSNPPPLRPESDSFSLSSYDDLTGQDLSYFNFGSRTIQRTFKYTVTDEDGKYTVTDTIKTNKKLKVYGPLSSGPEQVILNGANFTESNLQESEFQLVPMKRAILRRIVSQYSRWHQVDLTAADLTAAAFDNSQFKRCILPYVNAACSSFQQVTFSNCDLRHITFSHANLYRAVFIDCDLRYTNFTGAYVKDCQFRNCQLDGAQFTESVDFAGMQHQKSSMLGVMLPTIWEKNKSVHTQLYNLENSFPKNSLLALIFGKLRAKLSRRGYLDFQILTLNELKILFQSKALTDKILTNNPRWFTLQKSNTQLLIKAFIDQYELFIKQANRWHVYLSYLSRFFALPPEAVFLITSNLALPSTRFLTAPSTSLPLKQFFFGTPSTIKLKTIEQPLSLVLIKAQGMRYLSNILATFQKYNLIVKSTKSLLITPKQAAELYNADNNRHFYTALIKQLTHETSYALVVEGDASKLNACKLHLRKACSKKIKKSARKKLIQYPTTSPIQEKAFVKEYLATFSIMHASDPGQGEKEIALFFKADEYKISSMTSEQRVNIILALSKHLKEKPIVADVKPDKLNVKEELSQHISQNLVIIKPEGMSYLTTILEEFLASGSKLLALKPEKLDKKRLQTLYGKYKKQYFYEALIEYVAEKTIILIAVEGNPQDLRRVRQKLRTMLSLDEVLPEKALSDWEEYIKQHPTSKYLSFDLSILQEEYRLTFDILHCSDAQDGAKEVALFFKEEELKQICLKSKDKVNLILNVLQEKQLEQTSKKLSL